MEKGAGVPDNRAAWNQVSAAYQARYRIPTDRFKWGIWCPDESRLRLLGDVRGKRCLVLGCGGGQDCVALARMGAAKVTGIDLSDEQIAYARRLAEQEGVSVSLLQGTAEDLSPVDSESHEIVASSCALGYVERIDRCFAEVHRVLVPGGLFAFSEVHPLYAITSDTPPYGFEGSYFQGQVDWQWEYPETKVSATFRSFGRTVSTPYNALVGAGFTVERILEPPPAEDAERTGWEEEHSLEKARLIPTTVIFVARRPEGR